MSNPCKGFSLLPLFHSIRIVAVPWITFRLRFLVSLSMDGLGIVALFAISALTCFLLGLWTLGVPFLLAAYAIGLWLPSRRINQ